MINEWKIFARFCVIFLDSLSSNFCRHYVDFSCVGVDWYASQCCKFDLLAAENCGVENLFDEISIIFCFKFIVNFFEKYLLEMFFAKLTIY